MARQPRQADHADRGAEDLRAEDGAGVRGGAVLRAAPGRPGRSIRRAGRQLAKHLGIAFQILNDFRIGRGDDFNKLTLGGDVLGGRPTVLWALALEGLEDDDRRQLEQLVAEGEATPAVFAEIRRCSNGPACSRKRCRLVDEHRREAAARGRPARARALRRLAHHLIETVLAAACRGGRPAAFPWPFPPGDRSRPPSREADLFTRSASRLATLFFPSLDELGGSSRWRWTICRPTIARCSRTTTT